MDSLKPQDTVSNLWDWADYLEAMKPIGDQVLATTRNPENPQDRQDTWRLLMATLAQAYQQVVYADPDYPEFIPIYSTVLNLSAPNPDYLYRSAEIDGKGVYRLRGKRGTNRMTLVSMHAGYYALGNAKPNPDEHDLDELTIAPDGTFSVILSQNRPEGYTGDWWYLNPQTTMVGNRVAAYDWANEQDSQIGIERLDVPSSAPRLSAEESDRRLKLMATWIALQPTLGYDRIADLARKGHVNTLEIFDYTSVGGAKGQVYVEGLFDLQPDEGLLLEAKVPDICKYWSFMLTNEQFVTIDWMQHQSSLNAFQAHIDRDGYVRVVISANDPGVPNWLDTGGYLRGGIQVRWNNCSSAPNPVATKIKLAELRRHVPGDTPTVSAAERDKSLRERRLAAQMRIRW